MNGIVFSLLAFVSCVIGAEIGIGGGLIMRPMLSFWGMGTSLASFSSAITVMAMAVVNLITVMRKGAKIDFKSMGMLAVGSILGGFLGSSLLDITPSGVINVLYIFAMVTVLLLTIFKSRLPKIVIKNPVGQAAVGLFTGSLSGLFGIGGGPFQMTALLVFFDRPAKDAAVDSIFITLLTTVASLIRYSLNGYADFSLAVWMIPAAIVGGIVGGMLNRRSSSRLVSALFCVVVAGIIGLQIYGLVS